MPSPPNPQERPLSCYALLDEDDQGLCNSLIDVLVKANRIPFCTSPNYVESFWNMVFKHWDTNMPIFKPAAIPERTAAQATLQVGILKEDCPDVSGQGKKRKREGTYVLPEARWRGEPVFLRLSLNLDEESIDFRWTDNDNHIVPARLVQLRSDLTAAQAKAELVKHWDRIEIARVGDWNESMVTYWARLRPVRRLERFAPLNDPDYTNWSFRPSATVDDDEDEDNLARPVLASRILKRQVQDMNDVDHMTSAQIQITHDFRERHR